MHRLAGRSRTRLRAIPPLLLRAAALNDPTLREVLEMRYLFEEPIVVDSSRIVERLGARATPVEQALAATVASYAATARAA